MNEEKGLGNIRSKALTDEGNDLARNRRQLEVVEAVLAKLVLLVS